MKPRLRLLVLAVVVASTAQAHSPGLLDPDEPFDVADATISRALYGNFRSGGEVFVLRMSFPEGFAFPLEVFVPHRDSLREHRPAYALVGPGLPTPPPEVVARLPSALPAGHGAFIDFSDENPRPVFYESFTRRFFWSSGVTGYVVPPGEIELWIWSPQGTTGKFGVGFGVEEDVDWREALKNWSDYAY